MTTEAAQHQAKSKIDVIIEEPVAKQPRHELATAEIGYEVLMLGGTSVKVQVTPSGGALDLHRRVRESGSLPNPFFNITGEGDRILVESDVLPAAGTALKLVVESPTELCEAAQKVIRESPANVPGRGDPALLERLRLGRCCELGTFECGQWTDHDDYPSDIEDYTIEEGKGGYHVCELELIDGEGQHKKLVAVISEGDTGAEIPAFGPVYLRPEFKRVACLYGDDEIASSWHFLEDASSWYRDPAT